MLPKYCLDKLWVHSRKQLCSIGDQGPDAGLSVKTGKFPWISLGETQIYREVWESITLFRL